MGTVPPAAQRAARAAEIVLAELHAARSVWQWPVMVAGLLWELVDLGVDVPEVFRGKMPPRPALEVTAAPRPELPAAIARPAIVETPRPTTVELIRALVRPDASDDDSRCAARALAIDLDDLGWLNWHRSKMAAVRAGTIPLKVVLGAYEKSRGSGVENPRKIFHDFIDSDAEDRELSNRTRPGHRGKVSRPGRP